MDKMTCRALIELSTTQSVCKKTAIGMIERLHEYEQAIIRIASLPEPLPKKIAQELLDKFSE